MRPTLYLIVPLVLGSASFAACSSSRSGGFQDPDNSSGGVLGGGNNDGGTVEVCVPNPNHYDVPGNNCDDDGDGTVDNPPTCDGSVTGNNAEDLARAMGICTKASEKGYGLVSATLTRGYNRTDAPRTEQHNVLPKFGDVITPREGDKLVVLSTGYAREYNGSGTEDFGGAVPSGGFPPILFQGQDWYNFGGYQGQPGNGTAPPGFPKAATGCTSVDVVNDVVNLKLELKAPPNAGGVKFDFNFYSGEWPAYICSPFNDGFIAYLTAKGFNNGTADNISFDKDNNPVSVNNGFFDRCTPGMTTGCAPDSDRQGTSMCPGGEAELLGTGFGRKATWCGVYQGGSQMESTNGGATGWLTSQAPVQAGETFTIEFMIWDTGDAVLDSSVLLDNFTWAAGNVQTQTDRPK